jgi:hypothetical protein
MALYLLLQDGVSHGVLLPQQVRSFPQEGRTGDSETPFLTTNPIPPEKTLFISAPHSGHFITDSSCMDRLISICLPQALHRYSYIGIPLSPLLPHGA